MNPFAAASIPPAKPTSASAPGLWRWRAGRLLLVGLGMGLLSIGHAAEQEAREAASEQAVAEARAGAEPTPVAAAEPRRARKICRSEEVTGSRMKQRVCLTSEQWAARETVSRQAARELQARQLTSDPPPRHPGLPDRRGGD